MNTLRSLGERTFASLAVRNYRLYAIGQGISLCGTWMQTIAQGLLVLRLTGSGTALGVVIALQSVPVLILGPWGGVVADRFPKRRILYATQASAGLLGLTVAALVLGGWIRLWMVYVTGALLGLIKVFDNPTRQTFVREMVGNDLLSNAVSLNSTEMNLARVIGPAIAGLLVATVGLGVCFLIDGLTYGLVVMMLARMRASELSPAPQVKRAKGQLIAGFRYVRSSPVLFNVLLMMAIIGTLTYEFSVSLPLLAEFTLNAGEGGYAALTAAMGIGAVAGGLFTAGRRHRTSRTLAVSAFLFGSSVLLVAAAPSLSLAVLAMVVVGFFSINFTSLGNVTLQLEASPEMQGRVMALWSVAFLGTTPFGGPIIGWIGEHAGARWSLTVGGMAALAAAGLGFAATRRGEQVATARGPELPVDTARLGIVATAERSKAHSE
jgi:MFS family permease